MLSTNKIKIYRSLQQKKYRQKYGQFLVEGAKAVQEFINQGWKAESIIVQDNVPHKLKLSVDVEPVAATSLQMNQISSFKTAAPVVGVFNMRESGSVDYSKSMIALDSINDPGNLGTIIRIADWYGIEQVLVSRSTVEEFNSKAISSTMGSFARVKVFRVDLLDILKNFNEKIYAAMLEGESIYSIHKSTGPFCLIIGSESHGIDATLYENLRAKRISIPRIGDAESLNAGVATGILIDRILNG